MKKENLKMAALIAVLCVIMGFAYVKINLGKINSQKCEEKAVTQIKRQDNDYRLHIDKGYQTKKDRCITFQMNLNLQIEGDKVVFAGTKTKEYNDIFKVSSKDDQVEITNHEATLDQNTLTVSIKASIQESNQHNSYDIEIKIPLTIQDGKLTEGK